MNHNKSTCRYRLHLDVMYSIAVGDCCWRLCLSKVFASELALAQGSHSPVACLNSHLFYVLNDLWWGITLPILA